MSDDVLKWMKRLNRKGPFFLFEVIDGFQFSYDTSVVPARRYADPTKPMKTYWVIWNDGPKTKIGAFEDHMYCRYGVSTRAVLNGDTPFDLWNGAGLTPEQFAEMLLVRQNKSELPHFDLSTLVGLSH